MEETTATDFSKIRILLVDNFDSFTYNLVSIFRQLGAEVVINRNDIPPSRSIQDDFHGLVLSPGPGTPEYSGYLMDYFEFDLPLLGVCLGHQALGLKYGGKLSKAAKPMHGKLSLINTIEDSIFKNIPSSFNVVRYHSLILKSIGNELVALAKTVSGEIMAIKHIQKPMYGIQYHPEAILTEYGYQLLKNWLNIVWKKQSNT